MPTFDVDLSKVGIIPEGNYVATIQAVEEKTSQKGSQYLNWQFFIPELGQTIFYMTSLAPTALFGLKKLVQAAGGNMNPPFNTDDLVSKQLGITVAIKEDPTFGTRSEVVAVYKA